MTAGRAFCLRLSFLFIRGGGGFSESSCVRHKEEVQIEKDIIIVSNPKKWLHTTLAIS